MVWPLNTDLKQNEYEGEINREITDYKKETNQDALDKVIEECPDRISSVEMEECVNDKVYDKNETNDEEKE